MSHAMRKPVFVIRCFDSIIVLYLQFLYKKFQASS